MWKIEPAETEIFIGLVVARGFLGGHNLPLREFWGHDFGCPLFSQSMSCSRFLEILRFLRFDDKSIRRERVCGDKFYHDSTLPY